MTTTLPTPVERPARPLLGLTATLFALLILNLTVFDDLRTDPSLGVVATFTKPPHLLSLATGLLAVVLVAIRHRHATRVAVVVAWLQLSAWTFLHGVPVEVGPTKPYWGPDMGDALQWVGFLLVLACCAAIIYGVRRAATRKAAV